MLTKAQMKVAWALLGIDQWHLIGTLGLSLPTIQRMEASEGTVRGNFDPLVRLVDALGGLGIELIDAGAASRGSGWGVRPEE